MISQDVPSAYGSALGKFSHSVNTLLNGPNWSMSLGSEDKRTTYVTEKGVQLVYKGMDSRPTMSELLAESGSLNVPSNMSMMDTTFKTNAGHENAASTMDFALNAPEETESGHVDRVYLDPSLMETSIATSAGFGQAYPPYHHPGEPVLNNHMKAYLNQIISLEKEEDDASIDYKVIDNTEYDNKVSYLPPGVLVGQEDVLSSDDDDDSDDNSHLFFDPLRPTLTEGNLKAHTDRFVRYNHDQNENLPFYNGSEQEDRFGDVSMELVPITTKFDIPAEPPTTHVNMPIHLRPDILDAAKLQMPQPQIWQLVVDGKILRNDILVQGHVPPGSNSIQSKGRISPIIEWTHPEDIIFPAALSDKELCAVAFEPHALLSSRKPLAGKMVYDPPVGTILPSGHNFLSVIFVPVDIQQYQSVSLTRKVSIFVRKGVPEIVWPHSHDVLVQGNPLDDQYFRAYVQKLMLPTVSSQRKTKEYITSLELKQRAKKRTEKELAGTADESEAEGDNAEVPVEQTQNEYSKYQDFTIKKSVTFTPLIDEPYRDIFGSNEDQVKAHEGEEFFYSHDRGAVLERGQHKIYVQYRPSKEMFHNYQCGYASIIVVIGARAPQISWQSPNDIKYLTELTHRSFKVTVDEPQSLHWNAAKQGPWPGWGSFTYEPPLGTVLDVGVHQLTAHFKSLFPIEFRDTTVTNTITVTPTESIIQWNMPAIIYLGQPVSEAHLNCQVHQPSASEGGGSLTYSMSLGTMLDLGKYEVHCKFTPKFPARFHIAEAKQDIVVNMPRIPQLYWNDPDDIVHPEPLGKAELCARLVTLGVTGQLIYDPPLLTILDAGHHELKVTFQPDLNSWAAAVAIVKIKVIKAKVRLAWNGPYDMIEQRGLHRGILDCRVLNENLTGILTYTPPLNTVLEIGEHKLHCLFTPAPEHQVNYEPTEAWALLSIRAKPKKRTTLTWKHPEDIVHPTPLSKTGQLTAVCNETEGTFNYYPRVGACLNVGKHELKVKFLPKLEDSYLPSEAKVTIRVSRGSCRLVWKPDPALLEFDYGTALSEYVLCAKALSQLDTEVYGEFIYTINGKPIELKQVLEAGSHEIKVAFTPDVPENFNGCEGLSVFVHVYRLTPQLLWKAPESPLTYPSFIDKNIHLTCVCVTETLQGQGERVPGKMKYSVKEGDILPVGLHQLFVRFEPDDIINYYSKDASIVIRIDRGTPRIAEWNLVEEIIYPEPLSIAKHLNAEADVDECNYSYNYAEGTILPVGRHEITCLINATGAHACNYSPATVSKFVTVLPTSCQVQWDGPEPGVSFYEIRYGDPLSEKQLCARLVLDNIRDVDLPLLMAKSNDIRELYAEISLMNPRINSSEIATMQKQITYLENQSVGLQYSPPLGTVLRGGKHKITCTFLCPFQCKNIRMSNTVKMTVVVKKSVARIEWNPKLPNLRYGDPLTATHLCARVTGNPLFADGTFVYKHKIGTILRIGMTQLEVQYIPKDKTSLHEATATNMVHVLKRPSVIHWPYAPKVVPFKYKLKASDLSAEVLGYDGQQLEGTFTYEPSVGCTLGPIGMREIRVEFCPRGEANKCYTMPVALVVPVQVVPPDSSSTGVATFH